jgi:DsbC/DsbD-like thiol-disulfide interchange protein
LSCKDVCIPGSAELQMTLPVGDQSAPQQEALFTEWEESLPVEAFAAGVQAKATGSIPVDGSAGEFNIELTFKDDASNIEWFPFTVKSLKVTDISVEGTQIKFKAAVMKGHELSSPELASVVTFTEGGNPRAVRVAVPLVKP